VGAHKDHTVPPPRPALAALQRARVEWRDRDLVGSVLEAEAQVGRWSDDLELSTNRKGVGLLFVDEMRSMQTGRSMQGR